ncbi:MAG: formylglycine-generating enzyme family protein, partial [bacterium]|nr:formylglycine-generating enzyme family protein [bacterium]
MIPFRIETVPPQGALRVLKVRSQWIDAHTPPHKEELDRLTLAVRTHLGKDNEDVKVKEKANPKTSKPLDVSTVESKAKRVYENDKGFREADYGDGIAMVYIPPGKFTMGSNDYDDEKPPHEVELDGYWMGKYEVTFDQYEKYCRETGKEMPGDKGWGRGNRPVINVSWGDAAAYCDWLSKKTGVRLKLPTEAQWEKAAKGT